MRWFAMFAAAALLGLVVACGDADRDHYIDEEPVTGSIDASWSFPGDGSLLDMVRASEVVVVADVIEVVGVEYDGPHERPESIPEEMAESLIRGLPWTTYRLGVGEWLKGSGAQEILITDLGGITPDGPYFIDSDFLLEAGRKYVMTLVPYPAIHGPGDYMRRGGSRGNFEVTDGFVHVLNHPRARGLDEQFGGMPLDEFVEVLREYASQPQLLPTPLPSRPPSPPDSLPVPGSSLVIDAVAVDIDIGAARANTATFLGSRKACNTLKTGGTLTIDITVDAVLPPGEGGGGIIGFQFALVYDPTKVKVSASKHDMLLAANSSSWLIPLGDGTPDTDGSFFVAVGDFSQSAPESGSGVLARITLQGVAPGVSDLKLADVMIFDGSNDEYSIDDVLAGQVGVDAPCP
jgi:hypothetical protein